MAECEVWVLIDENGDYSVGKDQEQAQEDYDGNINAPGAKRMVKLTIKIPLPVPVEVTVNVPEEKTGKVSVKVD
jgi:hypothetical protein